MVNVKDSLISVVECTPVQPKTAMCYYSNALEFGFFLGAIFVLFLALGCKLLDNVTKVMKNKRCNVGNGNRNCSA